MYKTIRFYIQITIKPELSLYIDERLEGIMPLSAIFQLYVGGQFYWWRKQRVARENHRHVASHWQTLSHNVSSSTTAMNGIRTRNCSGDRSCKSNSNTITTMTDPVFVWETLIINNIRMLQSFVLINKYTLHMDPRTQFWVCMWNNFMELFLMYLMFIYVNIEWQDYGTQL